MPDQPRDDRGRFTTNPHRQHAELIASLTQRKQAPERVRRAVGLDTPRSTEHAPARLWRHPGPH